MGMDTYREFTELNELWASGRAAWKVWGDGSARVRDTAGGSYHALPEAQRSGVTS